MKTSHLALACVLGAVTVTSAWSFSRRVSAGEGLTQQAHQFLATLSPAQREKATMDYASPQRVDWHFIPKEQRKGLQFRDMGAPSRQAALALLRSALSEAGYGKATRIMAMEDLLKELEKARQNGPLRDSERYYFTVFGAPSTDKRWGLSMEGHHLSLNFVVDANHVVSSTPAVFAANPAVVMTDVWPAIPRGARLLKDEEQLAIDLLASLSPEQRQKATIAEKAPAEVRNAGEAQPPQAPPAGIPVSELTAPQASQLRELIQVYAASMPEDVAQQRWSEIEQHDVKKVHFAWAGSEKPGAGHYYRVQGPTFLIEFINVQPDAAGNPANHIHCLWRDMRGDFALPVEAAK